jgi:hypothetical protein
VLLATFASLRWGELVALRREHIDLDNCEIRIIETAAELDAGGLRAETPKSRAGAPSPSHLNSRPSFAGILTASLCLAAGAWYSSAPRAHRCAAPTSGPYGTQPVSTLAPRACTFTI